MILKIEYIFIVLFILKMSQTELPGSSQHESSKTIIMSSYFPKILDKGTESHITWLLITCLIRNLIKRFDAIVFGGAVRDSILHSHASREFYKLSTRDKYDDPTIPVVASPQMGQQPLTGPVVTDLQHKPINQSVLRPVWAIFFDIQ